MKRSPCVPPVLCLCVLVALAAVPCAWADATANGQLSYSGISISPGSGSLMLQPAWAASGYAQAGTSAQYINTGLTPSAFAAGDYSTATGSASVPGTATLLASGSATAGASILGAVDASDNATARGTAVDSFMIAGGSGSVTVYFTSFISGSLGTTTDAAGQSADAETVFTLQLDGNPVLFDDRVYSIGPSDTQSQTFSTTLSGSTVLQYNTTYQLYIEADAEASVLNTPLAVPEPGTLGLIGAMAAAALFRSRKTAGRKLNNDWSGARAFWIGCGLSVLSAASSFALYIGADAPQVCEKCGYPPNRQTAGTLSTSLTEGNVTEQYPVVTFQGGSGPTLQMTLAYNSYNADGSRAQVDSGLGLGWTHSYNIFLFQQRGSFFRMGSDGRVTLYHLGTGGTYTADSGFFETLTSLGGGMYAITNKEKSWWVFGSIPNTPFLVAGPVYRLVQMGDRNNNITSLSYSNGLLTQVTDTYGRILRLGYATSNKLSTIVDPLGRTTTFQYDPKYRTPIRITDSLGKVTRYSYNSQYQLNKKIDRDGRTYLYLYKKQKPYATADSLGQAWFAQSNGNNWGVDRNALAYTLRRVYMASTVTNVDGSGNTWRYQYDTNGYIIHATAPDSTSTSYSYDPLTRQLSSLTDANGNVTRYQYDPEGNRTNMTDALGNVTTYTYEPVFNHMTSMTDPSGRVTTYQYDSSGNKTNEIDALGQTTRYTYDGNGNMLTVTDKNGNTTAYTYDGSGDRTSMTDPLGNVTTYAYDAVGNRVSTTDPLGRTTSYQYDGLDRLIGVTNALGGISTYAYDADGRQVSSTDPNGDTTTSQYDLRGRLIETVDALGGTTQYGYDFNDNRIASTNPLGNATVYTYDALNRQVAVTDSLGGISRYSYDAVGNRVSSTDPNLHTTTYAYDELNRLIGATNALGGVTTYDYATPSGPPCCSPSVGSALITRIDDAGGNITFFHYDDLNRRVQAVRKNSDANDVINPGDAVTTTAYDPVGNIVSVTDPAGSVTVYAYDADNRRTSMVNGAGDTTSTAYDAEGNVQTTTSPNGNVTTNVYDALDRVVSVYDAVGLVTTIIYDADGNAVSRADGVGDTTSYAYDALNRPTVTTDALGHTTITVYDAVGNVVSTVDRNGNATSYTYDTLNRRTSIINAAGGTSTTAYDAAGNVINLMDADGHTTSYAYDALNRRVTETYPDVPPNVKTYTYDAVGNVTSRTDQEGQVTTYTYDALYRLTSRSYTPSGSLDTFMYDNAGRVLSATRNGWVDTFAYDGADRVTTTVENGRTLQYQYDIPGRTQTNTYPSGRTIVYNYDARGRLASETDGTPNPPIAVYTYDLANRVVTHDARNGTTSTYAYNADNWITSLEHSNAVGRIAGFGYSYDFEGNRLDQEKRDDPVHSQAYAYDALNRLTNGDVGMLVGQTVPAPSIATAWILDPVGNWSEVISNGVPEVQTFGTDDELLTENGQTNVFDGDGNLARDAAYSYAYDEENRLMQVQRRSDSVVVGQYTYDAFGRRVMDMADASGIPTTTVFIYDDARIIEERDGGGSTMATYTYGNYVDEVLTMDRAGQTYYYHPDALWSVEALSDASGNVAERYSYDAYGVTTVLDAFYNALSLNPWGTPHSLVGNPHMFTGREMDQETGLYFYRARYYDSVDGRFLQKDPHELAELELNEYEFNPYSYVGLQPTRLLDPTGLRSVTIVTDGAGNLTRVYSEFIEDFTGKSTTIHKDVSNLKGVVDAILSYKEKEITRLYLGGHGAGCGCAFKNFADRPNINGRGFETLDKETIEKIKKRLAPDAEIWVMGCSAGGDVEDGKKLAKLLGRPVFAQTGEVGIATTDYVVYLKYGGYWFGGSWIRYDPNGDITNVTEQKKVSAEDIAKIMEKERKKCGCKAK